MPRGPTHRFLSIVQMTEAPDELALVQTVSRNLHAAHLVHCREKAQQLRYNEQKTARVIQRETGHV